MDPFDTSPCRHFGLAPEGKPHPCLDARWGDRPCPVDTHCREWLREREREMYRLGYPYASWVVRRRLFGLGTECALHFARDDPAEHSAHCEGDGVLRVRRAI